MNDLLINASIIIVGASQRMAPSVFANFLYIQNYLETKVALVYSMIVVSIEFISSSNYSSFSLNCN
jgi:hypothetical protein